MLTLNTDPKVWRIDWRPKFVSCANGAGPGEWEPMDRARRYNLEQVTAFEQNLSEDDLDVADYRAVWGSTTLPLCPRKPRAEPDFVHLHTTMQPDEALPMTGWPLVLAQLAHLQEARA